MKESSIRLLGLCMLTVLIVTGSVSLAITQKPCPSHNIPHPNEVIHEEPSIGTTGDPGSGKGQGPRVL